VRRKKVQKLSVMVTGLGGGGNGEQIFKALRRAKTDYRIIGGDMNINNKGVDDVDYFYQLPAANESDYIDCLLAICRRHDIKAVFHGSEPELLAISRQRKKLEDHGIFLPMNPYDVIEICMDKNRITRFLHDKGFVVPRYWTIKQTSDLNEIDQFPLVLKPSIGGGGSANVFIAQSQNELAFMAQYLLGLYNEFIVQEYVGTPDEEYTVGVLTDMEDGSLINSIVVKRMICTNLSTRMRVPNRTDRTELGPQLVISSGYSQGWIGSYKPVTDLCEKIAMALGSRGSINIQCRLFRGKVYVFEINPRFSGTTSLRSMVGYNEPDIILRRKFFGERPELRFPYHSGIIMRGVDEVLLASKKHPHARSLI
jgi:carbamoyl-phosphate synthase large subunit